MATAYKLLLKNPQLRLLLLEKENHLAGHQTGNNSGVIHSGIYYKPGSLKARNCREGVRQLLNFCEEHQIPYELCGKVITATTPDELPRLDDLYKRGTANGVPGLRYITKAEMAEIEPHVAGLKGLLSPGTGIVDYTKVSEVLGREISTLGGDIKTGSKVLNVNHNNSEIVIQASTGDFSSKKIINCAGLFSDRIANKTGLKSDVRIVPFRGEYYSLTESSRSLVKNLIYPVPDPKFPFLGVHFTRGISGEVEAGPNAVFAFAREGYKKYQINPRDLWDCFSYPAFWTMAGDYWKIGVGEYYRSFYKPAFVKALQKLIPEIQSSDLKAGGAGVRAQALSADGKLKDDFVISRDKKVINVLNAPSPAATSCLAIADSISGLISD